jgi:hypothetical protein
VESLNGWAEYSLAAGVPEELRAYLEKRFERLQQEYMARGS